MKSITFLTSFLKCCFNVMLTQSLISVNVNRFWSAGPSLDASKLLKAGSFRLSDWGMKLVIVLFNDGLSKNMMLSVRFELGTFVCIGIYFSSDTWSIPSGQSKMGVPFSDSIYWAEIRYHFDCITWFVFDTTWIWCSVHFWQFTK